MKRILIGLTTAGAVLGLTLIATNAFFSDVETSSGNTFTAGGLDLKVDSTCHYWQFENQAYVEKGCGADEQHGNWTSSDIGVNYKFFNFADVKPGDKGENTVSLTVENDAWLRLSIKNVVNSENSCTEPEDILDEPGIPFPTPDACGTTGELGNNLKFTVWLDQGLTPGFGPVNNSPDRGEGNNILDEGEPTLIYEGTVQDGENWNLSPYPLYPYLKKGDVAYFGIAWNLPSATENEVQSDSMTATMEFQVQQHRNNPVPTWTP